MTQAVVYSDLDGTLLDHHTYDWSPAAACLAALRAQRIPIIPCTSKTRSELLPLREALQLEGPFIVENGAAVVFPDTSALLNGIPTDPLGDGYRVHALVAPRSRWLALIEAVYRETGRVGRGFSEMSLDELVALTGLPPEAALLAAEREYGEPLHWLVPEVERQAFVARIEAAGGVVLQGGRFAHVSGPSDKGRALRWLQDRYQALLGQRPVSIAAGDSGNDIAMLEAADWSLVVRSPAHPPPYLARTEGVLVSRQEGPAGWAEGIDELLSRLPPTPLGRMPNPVSSTQE